MAAIAMLSDLQRLELQPFGITVVDLKTGVNISNLMNTRKDRPWVSLPKGWLYEPDKEAVESSMNGEKLAEGAMETQEYGGLVVRKQLKKTPPQLIWTGGLNTWLVRLSLFLPFGTFDGTLKTMTGLEVVVVRVGK